MFAHPRALFSPRALATLLICGAVVLTARADAVWGEVRPIGQPDGSLIQARVWGDEYYSVVESLDGYTLVRDPADGFVCYATVSDDGTQLRSTGVRLDAVDPQLLGLTPHLRIDPKAADAQAYAVRQYAAEHAFSGPLAPPVDRGRTRTVGDVVGITLIIDFSDDPATIPAASIDAYCNQVGYTGYNNNGSVHDYYYDVSEGLLNYTNYVPTAYYRAKYPKTYYNDPNISYGQRARELIIEALDALDAQGVDFSAFDSDGNGTIDALNCFYAGSSNSAWSEGLWPHAWSVYWCADGVCSQSYQITDLQSQLRLSTFVHENGHMLMGWPDLYDYGYDSTGVGQFCIMCYGTSSTNPCEPCAYMKYAAGWTTTQLLTTPQGLLTAPTGTNNVIFKYNHPTKPNEYYLIENRQRTGRDSGLPDAGLAIWHVDENGSNDNQQQTSALHYLVTLVQADGRWDLEHNSNYGDSTDLWAAPTYTECGGTTSPNTNWWDGSASGLEIGNISASQTNMTFSFSAAGDCNTNGISDDLDLANCDGSAWCGDCNGNGIPDECDIATGVSSDCNNNGVPDSCEADCNLDGIPDDCQGASVHGLAGAYFNNQTLAGSVTTGLIDDTIDFEWGDGAPLPSIGADQFSVRWSGYLETPAPTGDYTFYTYTDDGVRLWVGGQLLINRWVDQSPTEASATIHLDGERHYRIVMEYYENGGGAVAQLSWSHPTQTKEIIPATALLSGRDCNGNGVLDSCDIASGYSLDVNGNGIADDCERLGDMNCDGDVNFFDIDPFVLALTGHTSYHTQYPQCDWANADTDGSGSVDFFDIDPFVVLLTQ